MEYLLRGILAAEVFATLLLLGFVVGDLWHGHGWATRTTLIGLSLVDVYVLVGQAKAFNLGITFDQVSAFGLGAYTVLLAGLSWLVADRRRTRGIRRDR